MARYMLGFWLSIIGTGYLATHYAHKASYADRGMAGFWAVVGCLVTSGFAIGIASETRRPTRRRRGGASDESGD